MSIIPVADIKDRVMRLQAIMEREPQADCPVRHHFAPGIYAREMTIPEGVTAVGAVHKTEHLSIISAGHCFLTTDEGVREIHAPFTMVSKAGAKRALHALTQTVMTTIHPTDERDLDKLCELLTESKSAELIGGTQNRQMLNQRSAMVEQSEVSQ